MKRRWRIVLMRKTGEVLGTVEAADAHAAEKVAAIQFELGRVLINLPSQLCLQKRTRERTSRKCGRLRVGKENLHGASLVGAAMCSAC
jgi:isopentenyldiphosphate isomerase